MSMNWNRSGWGGAGRLAALLWIPAVLAAAGAVSLRVEAAGNVATGVAQTAQPAGFLETYCVGCHNDRTRTGGLSLEGLTGTAVGPHAEVWERVVRKLRAGAMPPAGARRRPDGATLDGFLSQLEASLATAAEASPAPGAPAVRRLNRVEYANAVRDLLGVEIDPELMLPADDEDQGFDNIAEALATSPTLLERYLSAARRISRLAVGDGRLRASTETYMVPEAQRQDDQTSDDAPFGTRGGVVVEHRFPLDGDYLFKVRLRRNFYGFIRGMGRAHRVDVRIDGRLAKTFAVGGEFDGDRCAASYCGQVYLPQGDPGWTVYLTHADDSLEVRVPVRAGARDVAVVFLDAPAVPEGILQPPTSMTTYGYSTDEMADGLPAVASLAITGPFEPSGPGDTLSRRRIFICQPVSSRVQEVERCATRILLTLARHAYRRPATDADVQALFPFYEAGRTTGGFEAGIQAAIERLLVDPEFVYRIERVPAGPPAARVDGIDLASRLSFFVWSSIPDDELLEAAEKGTLGDEAAIRRHVRRMLQDPRSEALVDNFFEQWLQLRNLRNAAPDGGVFPGFDENLRAALRQETHLFLNSLLQEDRSVLELLRSDYTFVNERLAQHYGMPNVYGPHFRRVPVDARQRGGILGHGSILTLTSYSTRTSPVSRGKWVLEHLLGTPPPPPPPNVPALPERSEGGAPTSVRERLERHRRNPTCATCHRLMDPLGFALEHYDAIGRWRTSDSSEVPGEPEVRVDASGVFVDGTPFEGLTGLRDLLLSREEVFVTTVTEKLLMYALGRRVDYKDMPAVRQIVRRARSSGYSWSSIIAGIATSAPFRAPGSVP